MEKDTQSAPEKKVVAVLRKLIKEHGMEGTLTEVITDILENHEKRLRCLEGKKRRAHALSDDALVFRAIKKLIDENPQATKLSIQEIAQELNQNLPLKETFSDIHIGRVCSRLDFKRVKFKEGRGIRWNKVLLERLNLRFESENFAVTS